MPGETLNLDEIFAPKMTDEKKENTEVVGVTEPVKQEVVVEAEKVVEAPKTEAEPVTEIKVEKGWFNRTKESIKRSSENFVKRIGAGALEMFDNKVTSRLSAGPKRQIEKQQAIMAKSQNAMNALNELLKNNPAGYSTEKAKSSLLKLEEKVNSSKEKIEASTEKLNTRNKWQESVKSTRNEFLKSVAGNYSKVESNYKDKMTPLEKIKADCERERQDVQKRNEERNVDIATFSKNAETFKAQMKSFGFTEDQILREPALIEISKTVEKINEEKEKDLENLKKKEGKNAKKLSALTDKYNKVSKKRKDCETSMSGETTAKEEVADSSESKKVEESTSAQSTYETKETLPTFTIQEQTDVWNKLTEKEVEYNVNTDEINARFFKSATDKLTVKDYTKIVTTFFTSRGADPAKIATLIEEYIKIKQ